MSEHYHGHASQAPEPTGAPAYGLAFPEPLAAIPSVALHAEPHGAYVVPTLAAPLTADSIHAPIAPMVLHQLATLGYQLPGIPMPLLEPDPGAPLPGDAQLGPEPGSWLAVKNIALVAVMAIAILIATSATTNIFLIASFASMALLLMVTFAVADRWRFQASAHTTVLAADGSVVAVVPPGGSWQEHAAAHQRPRSTYRIDVT